MFNFACYMPTIGDEYVFNNIQKEIDRGLKEKKILDASIFYDQVGKIDTKNVKCGLFPSTDAWHFKGKMFVVSPAMGLKMINIVNDINVYFGHGWGSKNVLSLLYTKEKTKFKIIASSEEYYEDYKRLTGEKPEGIAPDFKNLIDIMSKE